MGRLILLIIVIALVIVVVGTWKWVLDRSDESRWAKASSRKAQIRALERTTTKQESVLREIQELATSSGVATGDPLWEVVAQKIEEVLDERKDRR